MASPSNRDTRTLQDEFFGAPPQQAMQRTAAALWPLLEGDARFAYEGRFVGFDAPALADADTIAALVAVQGGEASFFVDAANEAPLTEALHRRGLTADRWDQLMGGRDAIAASRTVVAGFALPEGFAIEEVSADTAPDRLAAVAAMAMAAGVMLPAGAALRGVTRRAVAFFIVAPDGRIAACSGAVARHHAASPFADASWWGMLATADAFRGRGFSKYLGALAIVAMSERHGIARFYSGVRSDNAVSQKLCRGLRSWRQRPGDAGGARSGALRRGETDALDRRTPRSRGAGDHGVLCWPAEVYAGGDCGWAGISPRVTATVICLPSRSTSSLTDVPGARPAMLLGERRGRP